MQSSLVSCPLEMNKIPVPRCDAVFDANCMGKTEIPFIRTKYDKNTGHGFNAPREQVSYLSFSLPPSSLIPEIKIKIFENAVIHYTSIQKY